MFGASVICYLFFGGAGGGVCVIASLLGLLTPCVLVRGSFLEAYRRINVACYALSAALLAVGSLCLMADGVRVEALAHLFLAGRFTYLNVGAYALVACTALCLLAAVVWFRPRINMGALRTVQALSLVAGAAVILYTGLFLAGTRAVALWNTPWLPVLFVLSGLSCGMVLIVVVLHGCGLSALFASQVRRLVMADVVLLVLEAMVAAAFVFASLSTGASAAAPAQALIAGSEAWVFWAGFVGVGLAGALAAECLMLKGTSWLRGPYLPLIPAGCTLVGAFAMRASIVMAGSHPVVFG